MPSTSRGKLTRVPKDDYGIHLGGLATELLGSIVDQLTPLRVPGHDDLGVGAVAYGLPNQLGPGVPPISRRSLTGVGGNARPATYIVREPAASPPARKPATFAGYSTPWTARFPAPTC